MNDQTKDAIGRIELKADQIATAVRDQTEQLCITNARLDEIVALLTPGENSPGEPTLSDLIAHLIMQGGEQLMLARKTIELLIALQQNLPDEIGQSVEARLTAKPSA